MRIIIRLLVNFEAKYGRMNWMNLQADRRRKYEVTSVSPENEYFSYKLIRHFSSTPLGKSPPMFRWVSQNNKKILGRWNMENCNEKTNRKIDWSNVDHCGPCGMEKIVTDELRPHSLEKQIPRRI